MQEQRRITVLKNRERERQREGSKSLKENRNGEWQQLLFNVVFVAVVDVVVGGPGNHMTPPRMFWKTIRPPKRERGQVRYLYYFVFYIFVVQHAVLAHWISLLTRVITRDNRARLTVILK